MAVNTSSQKRTQEPSKSADPQDQTGKKSNPFDRNHNGRIDPDDLLLGIRDAIQWVISWRGAMILAGGFTVYAASLNINSHLAPVSIR